jgi:hypothetical protein
MNQDTPRTPYEELVWQLGRLPGGAEAAIPDFFGRLLAGPIQTDDSVETWPLHGGGRLSLASGILSVRVSDSADAETPIAPLPPALLEEAGKAGISPLLLGLLALATGDLDGDRKLKGLLPLVDGAAKDLMLMTVCRLCG